ncbi:hypothetical protein COCOBI_04-4080 [Coccomyxa sp. Obi]|nr:hypothetical protein COCOBI_04-4080 [Coccomyxa sp. Obi]
MHSFSGHLALSFAPTPQPADCRLTKVKQAPSATWLRSGSFATLTLGIQQQDGGVYVQVHLKGTMLLHISGAVPYSLLTPEDTGQGWIFAASVPESVGSCTQIRSYAFNFVPAEGGKHCQLALQELYQNSLLTRTASVNVRPAVESAPHTAAQTSNGPNEACSPPSRLQAHAGTQASQAAMDWMVTRDMGLNHRPALTDAEIKDAIRTYIADPEFHRYVDRMEQLWDSVEEEMLQQAEYEGMEVT